MAPDKKLERRQRQLRGKGPKPEVWCLMMYKRQAEWGNEEIGLRQVWFDVHKAGLSQAAAL